jgi:hypothetical protein
MASRLRIDIEMDIISILLVFDAGCESAHALTKTRAESFDRVHEDRRHLPEHRIPDSIGYRYRLSIWMYPGPDGDFPAAVL